MQEIDRVVIPAQNVQSLCWQGDALVDWAGGGTRYRLDGTSTRRLVSYSYKFNRAVTSPNGQYAVIYDVLGTKGLVLKDGEILREINRSFYHANVYEYPVALFDLPNGRTVLAHCPDDYNRLEIEDADTGERLTQRSGETTDFFQSRLSVSPGGKYLMSAGWIWTPIDFALIYDLQQVLAAPALLDTPPEWNLTVGMTEIHSAVFADAETVIFASADLYFDEHDVDEEDKEKFVLQPDQLGLYSLTEKRFLTLAPLAEPLGTLMPVGDSVIGFYEHPKLVEVSTGQVITRWPDLSTGNQNGSISQNLDQLPPLALDPANKRFAVADGEQITVVQLGHNN